MADGSGRRRGTMGGRAGLIVGRADEVRLVRDLVDAGRPGVLLLEGEAGIGKTTLLDVACSRAERAGAHVLQASAEEHYGSRPLALLAEALGSAGGPCDEAAMLAVADERWRPPADAASMAPTTTDAVPALVDLALDVLEAASQSGPVLVALDDLQWADPASLLVLGPLVRRSLPLGVAFAVALRPVPRPRGLDALRDQLAATGAVTHRVGPLTEADVERLAEMVIDGPVAPALLARARRAGGNPFLVRELVRSGAGDERMADDLVEVVARRLRAAGDRVAETLRVAAVLGGSPRPDDLAAIIGRPLGEVNEALVDAAAAGLLLEGTDGLTFRHDLVREALLAQTPESVRRALHRRAAAVLGPSGARPEVVAGHLLAGAEDGDRAVITALREVSRTGIPIVTADLLAAALDRCDADDPQRAPLALEAANALVWAGRPLEAVAVVTEALQAEVPPEVAYELRACRSHALFTAGDPGAAVTTWLEDDDHDRTAGGHHLELAEVALARLFAGDASGARRDAESSLAEGSRSTGLARATAHGVLAWLDASSGDLPSALAHADASVSIDADLSSRGSLQYGPHLMRAAVADAAGDHATVAQSLQIARRQVAEHGMAVFEPMIYAVQAVHDLRTGSWDDALAATEAGASAMADAGVRLAANWLAAVRALVQVDRDDPVGASRTLDTWVEPGVLLGQDWVTLARARSLEVGGDAAAAAALLGMVLELMVDAGARSCLASAGPDLARLAAASGDRARLAWLVAATDDLPPGLPAPMDGAVEVIRARADADADALLIAGERLVAAGRRPDGARAIAEAAILLAEASPDAARHAARRATALFDACGAVVAASRLRSDLRGAGVRFRAAAPSTATVGWDALTPTERRIVALVAEGLTNGAIAERLVVSRRTVESHLVRTYRKLSVGSRVELARLAADQIG